ncbi:hypothetical protein LOD99_13122 [Oopsacas minuta]|uniref:Roadblock/LAMTOR2 domain-containing protein n=1 Tax=Oopsacas minuta TaxID=111878 RepID=A0AAV7JAZ9_9METZ|nr:hypothetical protein LOD99_13122 [Oopsacas minuta]
MQSQGTFILESREVTSYLTQTKANFPSINTILLLDKVGKVCASSGPAVDSLSVATLANTIWRSCESQIVLEFPHEEVQAQFIYLDNMIVLSYKLGSCLLCIEFAKDVEVGLMNSIASSIAGHWP